MKGVLPLILIAGLLSACRGSENEIPPRRPNVVIMMADDLGWNDVGYHGSEMRTPRIDGLAESGVVLDRFYTAQACVPSRVALMTGRYPHRFQRGFSAFPGPKWGLDADETILPEVLAAAGYERRACIGKWHLGRGQKAYHPLNRGFTYFYGLTWAAVDYFSHTVGRGRETVRDWYRNFEVNDDQGYATDLLADEAVHFIRESSSHEPFFLYVPFTAPHLPFQAKEEQLTRNPRKKGQSEALWIYSAMISSLDEAVGRILDALEEERIAGRTFVWFLSDNGGVILGSHPESGPAINRNHPLRGSKGTVKEGGVRVPAVVRWPDGITGGRKVDEVLSILDVLPTLEGLAGVSERARKDVDGVDVLDVLSGKKRLPDRELFLGRGAVVTKQWKFIRNQLYRIDRDPSETANVASDNPDVVKKLQASCQRFRRLAGSRSR